MPVGGGCCGEGKAGLIDRFLPNWLVGNVPFGDSSIAYSLQGFHYIPDTGNGAGLAAALAAAANAGGGVVAFRHGTYDLRLAGSPASPMAVGTNVTLLGPGAMEDASGELVGPIVGRETGNMGVFTMARGSAMADVGIAVLATTAPFSGATAIISSAPGAGASVRMRDVRVRYVATVNTVTCRRGIEVLSGHLHLDNVSLRGSGFHQVAEANWTRGLHVQGVGSRVAVVGASEIDGWDVNVMQTIASSRVELAGGDLTSAQRRVLYQTAAGMLRVSGARLSVSQADAYLAEVMASNLPTIPLRITDCVGSSSAGGLQTVAGILVHGGAAPTQYGHAKIDQNQIEWQRAGAVIELGPAGGVEVVSCCGVEGNILVNDTDPAGVGVLVSNANCLSNNIGGGVIGTQQLANMLVDNGTNTQSYPIGWCQIAPENLVAPVIALDPDWSQLLVTSNGTWTGSPTSYTYQWFRAGVAISGATGISYTTVGNDGAAPGDTDYGPDITCEVTAHNAAGASLPATSNTLAYLPTDEAETDLYLDPNVPAVGAVASWPNEAGGSALAAAGAARPTKSATSLNGTPGVTFDGVANVMQSGGNYDLSAVSSVVEIAAFRYVSGQFGILHGDANSIGDQRGYVTNYLNASKFICGGNGTAGHNAYGLGQTDAVIDLATDPAYVVSSGLNLVAGSVMAFLKVNNAAVAFSPLVSNNVPTGNFGNLPEYMGALPTGSFQGAVWGVRVRLLGVTNPAAASVLRVQQFCAWRAGMAPL